MTNTDPRPGAEQRKILVIGASGYLGRSITTSLQAEHVVVPTHCRNPLFPGSTEFSFFEGSLAPLIEQRKNDTVVFAAEVEKNQARPELNDPEFLRQAFGRFLDSLPPVRFVYISSDGIFDGRKGQYRESDIPEPKTSYGHNLQVCEELVRAKCAGHCIIRPSYLYGSSLGVLDKRLQKTKDLCKAGRAPAYFDDMFKSPMHVGHAANVIGRLVLSEYVGTVHVAGPRVSVFEFHSEAMRALGVAGSVRPEKMPADGGLVRDTSLDVTLCTTLTGFVPLSVRESIERFEGPSKGRPRE